MKILLPYRLGDGRNIGTSCSKFLIVPLVLLGSILLLLSVSSNSENRAKAEQESVRRNKKGQQIFKAFYDCVEPKLSPFRGNNDKFWLSFVNETLKCDNLKEYESFNILPVANKDEIKYFIPPNKEVPMTMVTLGIGHDVDAEKTLKQVLPKTEFFGADPTSKINKDLYEKDLGGKYFEYAVGGQNGIQEAFVLIDGAYSNRNVLNIEADLFLRDEVQKQKVDILWMDIEGHEFPVLEMLHRGGAFDNKGVKICQINTEIHKDLDNGVTGEQNMFHEFVWKLLEDGRYVMVKPFLVYFYKDFIRTTLINVHDKECTDLYIK
ncbi:Methyltransferase FkbM domain-containing protein [Caenorhabditis elegans]|uniref:Methyltransferase FkbM domain-containing protein n=1 Tax=Caenorhabditis elegans TaxID=6239 RepID=Q20580_CAEEL|nr:Methyltransferase FkbM domain-containing protein [Caenorhabditis elegans]CAA92507.1 Methyltransferase FkbM domain-containing protein [Caenorhabditis elegans]|eukprot:NP_501624.1 Uncharacterized protein CELE_F49C12.2 [Caenorhabditis elegans]